MESLKLEVKGMTCDHCRQRVEKALGEVEGTVSATVFLVEGEAEVEFHPDQTTAEAYVKALESTDYSAKIVQ